MKITFTFLFVLITHLSFSALEDSSLIQQRIPSWTQPILKKSGLLNTYTIKDDINPFYLEADLNGDDLDDIAFIIENKQSKKTGVLIINSDKNTTFILGAGKDIGLGTDISWCTRWFVYRDKFIYNLNDRKKKFMIRNPAIEIVKSETISSIIYWDRRRYKTHIKHI